MRLARRFAAFWFDFLVGERPELFVGSIVCLVMTWVALKLGLFPGIGGVLLAVLIIGLGGLSLAMASGRPLPLGGQR
jgi:hypothetical protein